METDGTMEVEDRNPGEGEVEKGRSERERREKKEERTNKRRN